MCQGCASGSERGRRCSYPFLAENNLPYCGTELAKVCRVGCQPVRDRSKRPAQLSNHVRRRLASHVLPKQQQRFTVPATAIHQPNSSRILHWSHNPLRSDLYIGVLVHVTTLQHASTKMFHIQHNGVETASFEVSCIGWQRSGPRDWNSGHHDLSLGTASPAESSAIFPIFPTPRSPNRLRDDFMSFPPCRRGRVF